MTGQLEERIEMSRVDQIIGPYYCQTALRMCVEARALYASGEAKKASEICGFVSTLCAGNSFKTCIRESTLCAQVSQCYAKGQGSEAYRKGSEICMEARKLCPQNNIISGA
jgi:hypothetical protein